MSRVRLCLLGAGAAVTIMSAPVAAQQDSGPPTRAELDRQSAEAMAKSEAKVKAWFANPQVQALKARADGGDKYAQVDFADKIRDHLLNEIWSRDNIRQSMVRYYAMATAQNHGPAFARIGALAESVEYSAAMGRSTRDLDEAFGYYEKGAELRDKDAAAGYLRLAAKPEYCSFCDDASTLRYDTKKLIAAGIMTANESPSTYLAKADAAYRTEKRTTLVKAAKLAEAGGLYHGDPAGNLLATLLLAGVPVPEKAREIIYTDGKAVLGVRPTDPSTQWLLQPNLPEAERILVGIAMRNDILAMRRLADLYLKGRHQDGSASIAKSPENYLRYMNRAVEQRSMISAFLVGGELLRGTNIPADLPRGADYVSKAAAAGFGPAEELAGYIFRDGVGVEKNPELALQLFERAANNGQLKAAEEAEALYRAGYGSDVPAIRSGGALSMAVKAKQMRELSPQMADLRRRAHWDKFK